MSVHVHSSVDHVWSKYCISGSGGHVWNLRALFFLSRHEYTIGIVVFPRMLCIWKSHCLQLFQLNLNVTTELRHQFKIHTFNDGPTNVKEFFRLYYNRDIYYPPTKLKFFNDLKYFTQVRYHMNLINKRILGILVGNSSFSILKM